MTDLKKKKRLTKIKEGIKITKSSFWIFSEKSKKLFYKNKLRDCENNVKKTWDTIKDVIGESKFIDNGSSKMMVLDGCAIFNQNKIANGFNTFSRILDQNLHLLFPAHPGISKIP